MAKSKKKRVHDARNLDPAGFRRALFSKRGPIRNALAVVRQKTPPSIVAECVKSCLEVPALRAAFVQSPFPTAYCSIKPLRPFTPVSPEFDFGWTSVILEFFAEHLANYVVLRDKYYDHMLLGKHEDANNILDLIEGQFGVSIWLIGARIAALQANQGVTAQKKYLETLLNQSGLNVLVGTVAFYLSFAAEEHVSKAELDRELDDIWAGAAHSDIIGYFRYHSNPLDLPEKPYVVVALEENAPIIDRFESFVEMAQLQIAQAGCLQGLDFLSTAISRLHAIPDLRIRNLIFLFHPSEKELTPDMTFAAACDNYTLGNYATVNASAISELHAEPRKAWWYDLAVRGLMKEGPARFDGDRHANHFLGRILDGLERQREMAGDVDETRFKIQKLMLLGRRMPSSRYLASVDPAAMPMLVRDDITLSQWLWILSSPLDNPLHLRQIHTLSPAAAAVIQGGAANSPTMSISALVLAGKGPPPEMNLPADRRSQFEGHAAVNRLDTGSAVTHYQAYREQVTGADKLRSITLLYAAHRSLNQYEEALELISRCYLHEPAVVRLIPLRNLAQWIADYQGIDDLALAASIILHAYATLLDTDLDGDLSDAYENTLDYYEVDRPSLLLTSEQRIGKTDLVYFIRHVCTVARMEDGTGFDDVDAIERERVQLLQWLIGADQENASLYIAEIKAITKDQAVASMSAHLERSKIYVNEEAVRRSFDAEMRYSFSRFRELLIEPELEIRAEAIEHQIRKLLKDAESELRDLKLPSTERDGLFRSMFIIALQAFLVYPNGGLKTYLSTRILHGALEGEMRSNLARAQLLFPREKADATGDFDRAWSSQLINLNPAQFGTAREAVIKFSTRFSESVLQLKDEKVRIRLTTTPNGLLMYDSKDERMQSLSRRVSGTERYDVFVDTLFQDFWQQTEEGLERIKKEIGEVFAPKVEALLDALAASIEHLGDDASELLNAIVQARTEFALSVQRASAWFARSGSLPEEPFKLDVAIETAIRITNNCFPGLEIEAPSKREYSTELPGKWLNPIVDLLCNCLQNVVEHGGHKAAQQIELDVVDDLHSLSISIKNRLAESIDASERAEHIVRMLLQAREQHHLRATEELGSGFSKIVRILEYDIATGGTFDISVTEDRDAWVRVVIPREMAP